MLILDQAPLCKLLLLKLSRCLAKLHPGLNQEMALSRPLAVPVICNIVCTLVFHTSTLKEYSTVLVYINCAIFVYQSFRASVMALLVFCITRVSMINIESRIVATVVEVYMYTIIFKFGNRRSVDILRYYLKS